MMTLVDKNMSWQAHLLVDLILHVHVLYYVPPVAVCLLYNAVPPS